MKRKLFFSLILLALSVCLFSALSVSADGQTVYLKDGGTGDGSSPALAFGTIAEAYAKLGEAGGRIVICGSYELKETFTEPAHTGEIVITQKDGNTDYREGNAFFVQSGGKRYGLNGPVTFENMNFKGDLSASQNFILFICQFNPITFGEGLTVTDFKNDNIARAVTLLGGYQKDYDRVGTDDGLDSRITVKSGACIVVGFSRQYPNTHTGTAHIDIQGGEISTLYTGSVNAGMGGGCDVSISGGSFPGMIYACNTPPSYVTGNVSIKVTGGDFSACTGIDGTTGGGTATIEFDKANIAASKLCTGFSEIKTPEGVSANLIPDEVYASGTFTDSKGTTLPYRYYLPDGYDASKTYPVFFYLHGSGSRGSDNKGQLTATGAALNTAVLNSGKPVLMLAPQCPADKNWVPEDSYPGSRHFVARTEMTAELNAAWELLNEFVKQYAADTSRIYITGSSNGAGATWELVYRFPNAFAAAVPIVGAGDSQGASLIGDGLCTTPIWTFHGTADTSLSYMGTKGLVDAIRAAGGSNVVYTSMEGADHNTIWQKVAKNTELLGWIFNQTNADYNTSARTDWPTLDKETQTIPDRETATEKTTEKAADTATGSTTEKATEKSTGPVSAPSVSGTGITAIIIAAATVIAIAVILIVYIKKKKA